MVPLLRPNFFGDRVPAPPHCDIFSSGFRILAVGSRPPAPIFNRYRGCCFPPSEPPGCSPPSSHLISSCRGFYSLFQPRSCKIFPFPSPQVLPDRGEPVGYAPPADSRPRRVFQRAKRDCPGIPLSVLIPLPPDVYFFQKVIAALHWVALDLCRSGVNHLPSFFAPPFFSLLYHRNPL